MSVTAPDPALRQPPDFGLDAPDDATFLALGPRIAAYLLANFPGMQGLRQHRPHFDPARDRTTDPIEHTVEVLGTLDTSDLDPRDRAILRAAAIFHDIGKLLDPLNVRHAADSARMCPPYLPDFGLDEAACADATLLVRSHDVLGRVAQGLLAPELGAAQFGTRRLALLTARLTHADIASIRGLGRVLPSIATAYAAILRAFEAREAIAAIGGLAPQGKLWIEVGGQIALSEWRVALLEAVATAGSLAQAAEQLGVPYRTARYKLREIERNLGLPLLAGKSGGTEGGGSALTPEGRELVRRWRVFREGLDAWVTERFQAAFADSSSPSHTAGS